MREQCREPSPRGRPNSVHGTGWRQCNTTWKGCTTRAKDGALTHHLALAFPKSLSCCWRCVLWKAKERR